MKKILILICLLFMNSAFAKDMRFVQISDANFLSGEEALLRSAISEINKQPGVEFVVFTGDNIKRPSKKDLEDFLNEAEKLNCPFYIVLGDHDVNKHKEMSKAEYIKIVKKKYKKYKPETP